MDSEAILESEQQFWDGMHSFLFSFSPLGFCDIDDLLL